MDSAPNSHAVAMEILRKLKAYLIAPRHPLCSDFSAAPLLVDEAIAALSSGPDESERMPLIPYQQQEAKDAARYRWLRWYFHRIDWPNIGPPEDLDAAIDAAQQHATEGSGK